MINRKIGILGYPFLNINILLVVVLLLTACSSQALTAGTATTNQAVTPASPYGATGPVQTASPTNASPFGWLSQEALLFQKGDLPGGISPSTFTNEVPELLKEKYGAAPDGAATLQLAITSTQQNYGSISLYLYKNPATLNDITNRLIQAEENRRQGLPQPGIGMQALLFLPEQQGFDMALFFHTCRTFVEIRLFTNNQAIILLDAHRLAERVNQVDCQGQSEIPLQTPPVPMATGTAQSLQSISQGFIPNVTRLPDPDGSDLVRAYYFLDQQHGWLAIGASILNTEDGGQSWQPRSTAPSQVQGFSFQSLTTGWMETAQGYFATKDGGSTWTPATPPTQTASKVAPPPILKTVNGEDTFSFCSGQQAGLAGPFFALDARTAWAFCTSSGMDHFTFRSLYETTDGGNTWNLVNDQPPYGRFGGSDLFFLDAQHGWLTANDMGLYATSDGGRSWQSLNLFPPEAGNARQATFLSANLGFVIVNHTEANQGRDILLATTDGGKTWTPQFQAPAPALFPTGPFQFTSATTGIGAGDTSLLATGDAGLAWKQINSYQGFCQDDAAVQITALSFSSPEEGWLAYSCASQPQSVLYHTVDGGLSWKTLPAAGVPAGGIAALSFLDAQNGFLVTDSGLLLRTSNGGMSFLPVDNQTVHTASLHFISTEVGWENRGGQLFATQDGGKTWELLPVSIQVQYFSLISPQQAWLVTGPTSADNGNPTRQVFTTGDGGKTLLEHPFGELPSNQEPPFGDTIQFIDTQHGWLRAGTYWFVTADGGKDWKQVH